MRRAKSLWVAIMLTLAPAGILVPLEAVLGSIRASNPEAVVLVRGGVFTDGRTASTARQAAAKAAAAKAKAEAPPAAAPAEAPATASTRPASKGTGTGER